MLEIKAEEGKEGGEEATVAVAEWEVESVGKPYKIVMKRVSEHSMHTWYICSGSQTNIIYVDSLYICNYLCK